MRKIRGGIQRGRIHSPFPAAPSALEYVKGELFFDSTSLCSEPLTVGTGFQVQWVSRRGGSIQIFHCSEPKKMVWNTVSGRAFVGAALAEASFEESRGSFAIHDKTNILCPHQTVERVTRFDSGASDIREFFPLRPDGSYDFHRPEIHSTADQAADVDADGTSLVSKVRSVIVTGCLYSDATLARDEIAAFSRLCGDKLQRGPFYRSHEIVREDRCCWGMFCRKPRVGVRYRLVFCEQRDYHLRFSLTLDEPVNLDEPHGTSQPVLKNALSLLPRAPTSAEAVSLIHDQSVRSTRNSSRLEHPVHKHWLWSEDPVSAFTQSKQSFGSLHHRRRSFSTGDLSNYAIHDSSTLDRGSPVKFTCNRCTGLRSGSAFTSSSVLEHQQFAKFNRVQLTYASHKDERFFGFGEQFSHFDMKGRRVPILVQEQGLGRGDQPITAAANMVSLRAGGDWHTTYAPSPFYMTSDMRCLYLEGYEYSVFDLRHDDSVQVQVQAGQMQGRILFGQTPAELLERYTAAIGRMRELPSWLTKGAVVGMQGGTRRVRKIWQQLQDLSIPVSAFWLQDWVGQRQTSIGWQLWWNWEVDRDRYPGWEQLVKDLSSQGVRTMTYCNPFIAPVTQKLNRQRDLFSEVERQNFMVRNNLGAPCMVDNTTFDAAIVDLTNPAARAWLKDILREMVRTGVRGWMADFGEALPLESSLFSGEDGSTAHNKFPELWAQFNREFVEEWENEQNVLKLEEKLNGAGKERAHDGLHEEEDDDEEKLIFFMRAGYRGSPRWSTLFWEGDQMVSWQRHDGIKSAVIGLVTSGLCGYSLNHSDIGGYSTVNLPFLSYRRSEELFLRWTELNAFTTIFRTHEGNVPSANIQFYSNEKTWRHFARFAKVYKAWEFYRRHLVKEAATTGLPVVRHLFIHYPHDKHVLTISYQQYLVGSEFLVVPVLDKGRKRVEAYFPSTKSESAEAVDDDWEHLWTGRVYKSSRYRGRKEWIESPLGFPAIFVKEGSPIAMQFKQNLRSIGILQSQHSSH